MEKFFFAFAIEFEPHVELCRMNALRVLIKFGTASATSGRFYLRMGKQNLFRELTEGVTT